MTGSGLVMELTLLEAAHLSDLIGQFEDLVTSADGSDPALRRLVPDAYADDAEAASEFRRLTEGDLLSRRAADAGVVRSSLRRDGRDIDADQLDRAAAEDILVVDLTPDAAGSWLRTLAALRLVLADRLGVTDEDQRGDGDARFGVYEWIGYRLEMLVQALDS